MSIRENINNNLNQSFENHDYVPQRLFIEDMDLGATDFIKDLNLTVPDEHGAARKVPVIFTNQERWAEFRNNWQHLRDEGGTEITMPFMTIRRLSVKHGESPLKRTTIPNKKTFPFIRVPIVTNGTLKGYDIYKIPQPPRIDIQYELRFFSHYIQNVNLFYELMLAKAFSDGYHYISINGYNIPLELGDSTEENSMDDITADRKFQIICPITLHGKIVDPKEFEKVRTITKIQIDIKES